MGWQRDRIEGYFAACTGGSVAEVAEHFTDDAVIYDTNHRPVSTASGIGRFWEQIRDRWSGASWHVDTCVADGDVAAIEWTMTGDGPEGAFAVRGSEHYGFEDGRIAVIRQYWTFEPDRPGSALVDYPYGDDDRFHPGV